MKWLEKFSLYWFLKCSLKSRYRFKVIGLEKIRRENLKKKGGILFLANHPAEVDPLILINLLWNRFRPHPVAVDYLFQTPFLRFFLEKAKALSVPNFDDFSNSYKLKQIEKTFDKIQSLLEKQENILIYPAGGLKKQAAESIGGTSGIQSILNKVPDANVVLIRTTGLWGSSFSTALSGKTPGFTKPFLKGMRIVFENFLFFTPKRKVTVEFEVVEDIPLDQGRLAINQYLEKWYNAKGSEPLKLIPYHFWSKKVPTIAAAQEPEKIDFSSVDPHVKKRVIEEIEKLAGKAAKGDDVLAQDLGLDSLDEAQLVLFLKEYFGVSGIYSSDLVTVNDVIAVAAHLKKGKEREDEDEKPVEKWLIEKDRPSPEITSAKTIIEAFLQNAKRMDGFLASVDRNSGEVGYRRLKIAVILMAREIAKLKGKNIGIMMPASTGVNIAILATLLAGKVPVMINWTLGPRNLKVVMDQAQIEHTLSSWRFLDRLDNFDLNGFDNTIILLEEIRRKFSTKDKLKAKALSRKSPEEILRIFGAHEQKGDDTAVILFTSGTESSPKGVPLTHNNILSNQKDAFSYVNFMNSDVMLGVLPPFHSFGFSVTGLLPLLTGIRVAYLPNPTDGRGMAKGIDKWKVTMICLAPTFLKNMVRSATKEQLQSLKYVVCGAEKMPFDLYEKIGKLTDAKIVEGYGITECSPILTLNPPAKKNKGVGLNLPQVELKILHPETHEPLGVNKEGLIVARGPNIFKGYLDAHISSPFIDFEGKKWYITGDLGSLDEEGYLTLSGRLKRFVKIGGEMISLAVIEEALLEAAMKMGWKINPLVPSLAVGAKENNGTKPEICLFTTFPLTLEEANEHLRKSGMSNLFRLTAIQQINFIPLLGTGKIDYRSLNSRLG